MPRRFTKKQREWLEHYEATTGFDPLGMDDPDLSFKEIAKQSIQWFTDWSDECQKAINDYPGWLGDMAASEGSEL